MENLFSGVEKTKSLEFSYALKILQGLVSVT